jgi:hypothetical protein
MGGRKQRVWMMNLERKEQEKRGRSRDGNGVAWGEVKEEGLERFQA